MCDTVNMDYLDQHFPTLCDVKTVLEVGSLNVNGNGKSFMASRGIDYLGIDIRTGPDVDVLCDITAPREEIAHRLPLTSFDLVLCMNVLEHLFEPVRALDNMLEVLRPGGYLVVVTPAVWDLHDWPHDFFRLNPDFFRHWSSRNGAKILPGTFVFSARDTRRFYTNVDVLPMITPDMHGSLPARAMTRALALILREFRECWTRIYLNLIFQKP
jgi:SAM-dependent methyltransferase